MTRYALNYLYFARDELPMWYYRKVSIFGCIYGSHLPLSVEVEQSHIKVLLLERHFA